MGTLIQPTYTIPLPKNAEVSRGIVSWTVKGKKKHGVLSGPDRVLCRSECWVARFVDETGKLKKVSTKTKSKEAAQRILTKLENEVIRIRAGVMSRDELARASVASVPISEILERYEIKMIASGCKRKHIDSSRQEIDDIFSACKIDSLSKVEKEKVEKWIAGEIRSGEKTPRTINAYLIAVRSFLNWCVGNGHLASNPIGSIKKLNEEIGRKKNRRSLTDDELKRLFEAAFNRKYRKKNKAEEHVLVYKLLVGTGLRSTELSLATPTQFDFEKNRFMVKAANTKNKRPDILPLRSDLAEELKTWIDKQNIEIGSRIFKYDSDSIRRSFYADLAAAGIERVSPDGRSIDVHSLRRTFGTMLARAGVPLTTTQRLMRHSTPELTAKLYIDVEPIDMLQAVEKLPTF